jgi:hypothetical protein
MRRSTLMLAAATLVACDSGPTEVGVHDETLALAVTSTNAGGVTFAAGSGCTVVLSHFECDLTLEGVGSDLYVVRHDAQWSYTYQCLHKKTSKPSRQGQSAGIVSARVMQSLSGSNNQITISGTILAPLSPTNCATRKGAYTVTQVLSQLTPISWSLYGYKNEDPENYFASLFEVL